MSTPSTSSSEQGPPSLHPSKAVPEHEPSGGLPDHSGGAAAIIASWNADEYALAEHALIRKLDVRMVPWLTLLFTMSFLDRINIGTAKLVGLSADLRMSASQYNNASVIFFVSYVAFEIVSNLVLKRMKPSRWIPFIVICWSIVQLCMGFVRNYGSLLALRFLLGLFECGLFPGLSFLLSGYYKRTETSKRISIFFAGAVLAGAFGGILGYALSRIHTQSTLGSQRWRWIFWIEGALSLLVGIASIWMVQDFPADATFLTPVEKELLLLRIKADSGLASEGTFSWSIVWRAVKDWKTWALMGCYIGVAEPIYSQSLFTPTIVAALGKWSTAQSLLLSTPPYVLAFITTMATAYYSDKTGKRGVFLMFWTAMSAIGYILFLTIPLSRPGGLYFAVFLTIGGIAPSIATTIVWSGSTFGNHYKKAVSMGMVFTCGNSGGIVASEIYQSRFSPRFLPPHGVTLGFCVLSFTCAVILWSGLRRENRRRDELYGPSPRNLAFAGPKRLGEKSRTEDVIRAEEGEQVYMERWGLKGMTREEIIELGDDVSDAAGFLSLLQDHQLGEGRGRNSS